MKVGDGEYHPHAACLMFKACQNADEVRANLQAVLDRGEDIANDKRAAEGHRRAAVRLRGMLTRPTPG